VPASAPAADDLSRVTFQMLMGGGKTKVVCPLLGLFLAQGTADPYVDALGRPVESHVFQPLPGRLTVQVVPDQLMETARGALWSAFSGLIPKVVPTFELARSVKRVAGQRAYNTAEDRLHAATAEATSMLQRCQVAAQSGGVVLATPASVKSLVLRFVELCVRSEADMPAPCYQAATALARVLQQVCGDPWWLQVQCSGGT